LQDALCHPSLVWINRRLHDPCRPRIVAIVHQVLSRQPHHRWVHRVYRYIERAYLETTDGLLFASRFTRDAAREVLRTQRPMRVAHPGGDRLGRIASERSIDERSHRPGPLQVLFVGNLSPIKGLDRLLESLRRLPRSMWRLTVVGSLTADTAHVRTIRKRLAQHVLDPQVRLLGVVDGRNLSDIFAASQVFAMPFAHEGYGIAALEAMAFGLPVIGSTAGGVREFVRHGENGYLVSPGNHAAVGRYLTELYHDRERLAALGVCAYHTSSAQPTWEQSMDGACRFLEKLAHTSRSRPAGRGGDIKPTNSNHR
jgi:glycosyltransferase involved in cell wall biosynthesis